MTPDEIVTRLRAAAAAGRVTFHDYPHITVEDEAPEPSLAELCRPCRDIAPGACGTATCKRCGEPVRVDGSRGWWHTHGRRDHHAKPAAKEKP